MSAAKSTDRPVIRPMLMASDEAGATVSLMPEGALLLAGDAIEIDVFVGPGARLELVEPAGTVAYAMDGSRASWHVTIELAPASRLVWAGEPFVVAEGANVDRSTSVRMDVGASMAWREILVLGRHGERSGSLHQALTVTGHQDVPVLHEQMELGPDSSHLLLGGARAIGSVLVLGRRLPAEVNAGSGTRFELESDGTLVRHLATDAHLATAAGMWSAARRSTMT
jgi:urease accessory protein